MSCSSGCGCSSHATRHAKQVGSPSVRLRTRNTVKADAAYLIDPINEVVIATAPQAGGSVVAITFTLPATPTLGEPYTLVAAGAPITIDANGNTLEGSSTVALNSSRTLRYAGNGWDEDSTQPGKWI